MNLYCKNVIPVFGQGLYSIESEGDTKPLYDFLAEQLLDDFRGATLPPEETHKFAKACFGFLEKNNGNYLDLSKFLRAKLEGVHLAPAGPLWKLARIKSFNVFINTVYDDSLATA